MKILIAIPCLNKGGTEQQTLLLAQTLIKKSHQVILVVYFEYDVLMVQDFENIGAQVVCLDWDRSISAVAFISQLRTYFIRNAPDIVHVQYMAPGALPIIAAKLAGVPRIFATVHQPWTPAHGIRNKYILRIAAKLCNRFTVVSQNAEISWFGSASLIDPSIPIAKQSRHHTLYNAVDVNQLQLIIKSPNSMISLSTFDVPPDALIIGAVSRLRFEKGIDVLIRAFTLISHNIVPLIYLLIVGDGPDRASIEALADNTVVADRIRFIGATPWEISMSYMSKMDIVVVPSRFEGFGLTAAEAMALGKPVVVSETFGLTELIEDGESGLVFSNGDSKHLAEKLDSLIHDQNQAKRMAINALDVVRRRFDLTMYERNIACLYEFEQ